MGIAGDVVLIVVAGLAGGLVARLLRLPLLVGYVAAGIAVGPHTAGPTVVNIDDVEVLAELGVALLLFAIGLEVSLRDLGPVRRVALIGGPIQIALSTAFGTLLFRAVVGTGWAEALWFGAMVSSSSTMVVLKVLSSDGTLATLASRVMIGILVVQDLAVVPMLVGLPHVGRFAEGGLQAARAIGLSILFVAAMVLVGTRLLPAMLRRVLVWGSRELFLVAVVAAGVGVGYLTHRLGLSFALGAFAAGLVLSETELSHQALADVVPLRDIFALIFFVSVGMLLDPAQLVEHAADIALLVSAVIVGKALICGWLARAFGYVNMAPWLVGLGLAQIGEFGFVLARTGVEGGFLSPAAYDLALASAVLSMTISPLVFRAAVPIGRAWLRRHPPRGQLSPPPPVAPDAAGHVVVAGYGRTGRAVARALRASGLEVVVVDLHHPVIGAATADGHQAVWGDMSSDTIQHAARIETARALIVAVSDWAAARLGIEHAIRQNPSLIVLARASSPRRLEELSALGVRVAVQPEYEAGVEMMRQTLRHFDRDDAEIDRLTDAVRHELYAISPSNVRGHRTGS